MPEIYVSTDVEADGPIPGPHSMLSFASVALRADKTTVDSFSVNLETLADACPHAETERWWKSQPEAWAACRENVRAPDVVMPEYADWLESLPGSPVFVAYPLGFDFTFIYWYLHRFAGRSPFRHSGVDVRSYAMAVLGSEWRRSTKRFMPRRWFDELPHTHVALDDATEQGALFINMFRENTERLRSESS